MALSSETTLSPRRRGELAADPAVGGGNLLPSAVAYSPHPELPFLRTERPIALSAGWETCEFSLLKLDWLVQNWSAWYLAQGVVPRDRVAIYIEDSFAYSVHFYALAQIGAIAVLINSNAPADIARSLIEQTTPVGLYTTESRLLDLPQLNWIATAEALPAPPAADLPPEARFQHKNEDPVVILHSSGTTGEPKATVHTHQSIVAGPKFRLVDHKEFPGSITMTSLPQSHLGCIAYTAYALLAGANTVAAFDRCGAELVDCVVQQKPSAVMSFAHAYAEIPGMEIKPGSLDSVNVWVSIGDAVHESHIKHLLGLRSAHKPPSVFLDRLGTTELGWGVLLKIRNLSTARNDRCAGKPVGVAEVVVLRADGTIAADDEIGLLGARGPAITPGYWANADITYSSRLAGYWLTGDNAYRDANGDHFLVDRAADVIETPQGAGYSVSMEEAILSGVPEVVDASVIAGKHDGAVTPVALVSIGDAVVEAEKLLLLANEALEAAGHPLLGVLEISDSDVPVGVTGKVLKRQLREKYDALETYSADPRRFATV